MTDEEIKEKLGAYRAWEYKNRTLVKTYRLNSFEKALEFVNKAATVAEHLNHHPDILIHYNQVTFTLWSHDENAVTERDFKLMKEIEKLAVDSI